MTELSIVLISRNQEWNIARLIESVLREAATFSPTEIVLVDSDSTDRTTQIAANYPITVLKLKPDQRLSAAAGRYIGYLQTTGDLILFLDGDMELCPGWLEQAIKVLQTRADVAAVCGQVIDRPKTYQSQTAEHLDINSQNASSTEVLHGGGATIFRRSVFNLVGTFNPYLYSDEEPSLCLRIRQAGFKILRLNQPIVYHYTVTWEALSTFLDKRKGNIWLGYGQNIRYFWGGPLLLPYLKERGWVIAPALMLIIGIFAALFSMLTGQWIWFALWLGSIAMVIIAISIKKRSLNRAALVLFRRLLILEGTTRGFLLKPYDPAGYPKKYEKIGKFNGN